MTLMTKIEWVRGDDGSEGLSWNALRAVREIERDGKIISVSANHCEHVNEACRFCYAERGNARLGGLPFKPGHRQDYRFIVDREKLLAPLRRRKPTRIFVESMSDAFGEWWPTEYIDQLYAVMALTPQHTYINLSKRPERRRQYLSDRGWYARVAFVLAEVAPSLEEGGATATRLSSLQESGIGLPNVIEGTSVSNQVEADEFLPLLMKTPAALRCVSCEPLLGPIKLPAKMNLWDGQIVRTTRLDWVIAGGESGPQARPMNPQWARDLRDQCHAANIPFFFKQWGEWGFDERVGRKEMRDRDQPHAIDERWSLIRVGKKAAGRLLDGIEHNAIPARAAA